MWQRHDLRTALPSLRMPVLVTVGRDDWITPVAAAEEITGLIPGARLEVFENSGHSPQLEEPERFIAVVRDFLHDAFRIERESPATGRVRNRVGI